MFKTLLTFSAIAAAQTGGEFWKTITDPQDNNKISYFNFTLADKDNLCGDGEPCAGLKISGDYKVTTDPLGNSRFDLEGSIKSPKPWYKGNIFELSLFFLARPEEG